MTSQSANVVVFTPGDFQRFVHTLSEQRDFVAVGSIQRIPGLRRTEFLVRAVRCLPFSALAGERRHHPTRIEIGLAATSARAGAAGFLPYTRDSLAPGDCVIKLALSPALQPAITSGVVLSHGARAPVHAVRVGATTIRTLDGAAPQPSQRDRQRWSRLIGGTGRMRLGADTALGHLPRGRWQKRLTRRPCAREARRPQADAHRP